MKYILHDFYVEIAIITILIIIIVIITDTGRQELTLLSFFNDDHIIIIY